MSTIPTAAVQPDLYLSNGTKDTDFIGFSFNGKKSEDLGIKRVSDGSRYNEDLFGAFQDTTVQVPGGDGLYYFRTNFTQRTFNINIAFDKITESQFIELRRAFAPNLMGPLVFDERPYKAYSVKVQSPPQFKYLCFEENGKRVYKGEGTIIFVSYYPYASGVKLYLNSLTSANYPNKDQWKDSTRMPNSSEDLKYSYKKGITYNGNGEEVYVYNAGDVETDCRIITTPFRLSSGATFTLRRYDSSNIEGKDLARISFSSGVTKKDENDTYICINSKTNLVEGCKWDESAQDYIPTGTLYNEYISSGDFFKIPVSAAESDAETLSIKVSGSASDSIYRLRYNYLYY